MFCVKAHAPQPSLSSMQTVHNPKTEHLLVCQGGFALPFYFEVGRTVKDYCLTEDTHPDSTGLTLQ